MQEQIVELNTSIDQLKERIENLLEIKQALTVEFQKALSVINQLEQVCKENGIEIEFTSE